jgi:Rrf2 family nitric oxide-sensitive transcriptional repressor
MQLTQYTDYSLRVLIYLAAANRGATVAEIAERYGVSRHHLVKVAHHLGKAGYVVTERGRNGGLRLARAPGDINLGRVVRDMEPNFHLVECFNPGGNHCVITPACALIRVLSEANAAFFAVLDQHTLADVTGNAGALRRLLGVA